MRRSRLLACSLAAAALAASAPAPASAAGSGSAARQAASAAEAARQLATAAAAGDRAAALDALLASRRHVAAASRAAKALRRSGAPRRSQARAFRMVAGAYDTNLEAYAALLQDADPQVAAAIARALAPTLNGRDAAIAALTDLLALLPAPAREAAAAVIAAIQAGMAAEAEALGGVEGLPVDVQALVDSAFAVAGAAAASAAEQLRALLPLLPEAARGPVESALAQVTAQLEMVQELVGGILASLPNGILGRP